MNLPTQKFSELLKWGCLMEASLGRHDRLNHWPLVTNSTSSSDFWKLISFPGNKFPHPILRGIPKVTPLTKTPVWLKETFYEWQKKTILSPLTIQNYFRSWEQKINIMTWGYNSSYYLGNYKDFRRPGQDLRQPKHVSYYMTKSHTHMCVCMYMHIDT